ncbi:unnamed protein product [Heterobilharzia americana]|nr:unnamed protein product [Heterobilharzia americana]
MGWCRSKNINWSPPNQLLHMLNLKENCWQSADWASYLQGRSVCSIFFERRCLYIFETIRVGGYFECEHELDPSCVWPVKVLMNIGGRVLLSWFGTSSKSQMCDKSHKLSTFTLFYLNRRLHPLGYGKLSELKYCPPPGYILERAISNIDAFIRGACPATYNELSKSVDSLLLKSIFSVNNGIQSLHEFKVGWKLEAINPLRPYFVQPATVVKVFNSRYFLVELDDLRIDGNKSGKEDISGSSKVQFIAYAGMPEIMPVNESQLRGIYLSPPPGWPTNRYFTWTNYLTYLSAHSDNLNDHSPSGEISADNVIMQDEFTKHTISVTSSRATINTFHCTNVSSEGTDQATINDLPVCPSESIFKGIHAFNSVQKLENSSNSSSEKNFVIVNSSKSCQPKGSDSSCKLDKNESNSNKFLLGMKLEMVPPVNISCESFHSFEIGPALCTATVTRVEYPHLLWLLPDISFDKASQEAAAYHQRRPILMDARSTDLYPVGWSEFVGYPLIPPSGYDIQESCSLKLQFGNSTTTGHKVSENNTSSLQDCCIPGGIRPTHELQSFRINYVKEEICPPIFINSRCYLGPFLCKSNLELLPRQFGPGSVTRVLQCLITRLVRAAYKPVRVLRMFEADYASGMASVLNGRNSSAINSKECGANEQNSNSRVRSNLHPSLQQAKKEVLEQRREAMRVVLVSVRCPRRGIKIEVPVEVCCRRRAVEEYCRQISLVFEACPHLLTLVPPISPGEIKSSTSSNIIGVDTDRLFLNEPTQIPFENIMSSNHDCPSFCNVRLRSRYFDRLPGWKRRLTALRAFTDPSCTDGDQNRIVSGASGGHITRSTAAFQNSLNWVNRLESQSNFQSKDSKTLTSANTKNINRAKRKYQNHLRNSTEHCSKKMSNGFKVVSSACTKSKRSLRSKPPNLTSRKCHKTSNTVMTSCQTSSVDGSSNPNSSNYPICSAGFDSRSLRNVQSPPVSNPHRLWHPNHLSIPSSSNRSSSQAIPSYSNRNGLETVSPTTGLLPLHHIPIMEEDIDPLLSNIPRVILSSNPMFWTPVDLASYLGSTDCREMWPWLAAEAVDGQAFMLLTLPVLHRLVGLRWDDAVRLARHVISVKQAFIEQFSMNSHSNETYRTETR